MRKLRPKLQLGMRAKLAGTYALIIVMILLVINTVVLRSLEESYLYDRKAKTLANASIISLAGQEEILRQDRSSFYFIRNFGEQLQARVLVLDSSGRVTVDSFGERWLEGRLLSYPEVTAALEGNGETGIHNTSKGERVLYAAVPVTREKRVEGAVMLVTSLADIDATVAKIRRLMLLVSAAGGLFALFVGLFLASHFTLPLNKLAAAVRMVAGGHLNQRVNIKSKDEIGRLARDFNEMAAKLEEADRTLRHFLADASHELKTPLSSIKVLAQSLLDGREEDPAVYRDFLRDIDTGVDRMSALVGDMLRLTKLEDPDYPVPLIEQKVGTLLAHVKGMVQGQAAQKGIAVQVSAGDGGEISWPLNGDLFTCILLNLMDNAVRYTPSGGRVEVTAEILNGELVVKVRNTGIGIPAGDLPRIFDRFYRVDQARARETGGTGLGLAIVLQAVRRHGGTIGVESRPGAGTTFEVRFPGTARQQG